ncbi:LysR family transcriptional regulator [Pseudomonas japonica]|uniref:LysR family transcriptional regulator n=1 Tax=Pseudomonas TaxID=286 RepID=UPI00292A19BB|nr:LysR family transcriptional regulator [Pseudomonas sp. zfem002]MDU9393282.1 LysR family transcriptional regulator [Pseudomonas sp. zfem002]
MTFNKMHLIRQVDLFTLKLFLSAVEEQQIGLAAIRENIAASTATKRIQDLEEIAGVKLLERNPKGVQPSPAGAVLVRYLRTIFGQLDDMRAEISSFTEGIRGDVHVASARSIIAPFLARELGNYAHDYPLIELHLSEVENAEIVRTVANGETDVGVFAMAHEMDLSGVDVTPYRKDRMVAIVPRDHVLAGRDSVTFEDLLPESLIAVKAMLPVFRAAARRLGQEFESRFNVRSTGVAISLVQAGFGVTVQPECHVSRDMLDSVAVLDLAEPWANRIISIATPHGRLPSPAARTLLEYLSGTAGTVQS